ncbi:hypothetical protein GcC1_014013 [Golovinomyces cichoracearum]|uniref:Uncharacterized protein n=1 Tax=Golovinomyces cichoracearum TaxID=62708 RepID=A0A420J6N0_9PEZI|nr:hypothetical protein GcC1_014013 [Golovinomyces cichoracearum]
MKKKLKSIEQFTNKSSKEFLPTPKTTPSSTTDNLQQSEISRQTSSPMQASQNIESNNPQNLTTTRPRFFGKYSAYTSLEINSPIGAFHAPFQISFQNSKKLLNLKKNRKYE